MNKTIKVSGWSKNGNIEYTDIILPAKRIICPTCNGDGKHVNTNIDGNGLSQGDFDADPDFYSNYMGGLYDVECSECRGNKVLDVVDTDLIETKGAPLSWRKGLIRYMNGINLDNEIRLETYYERNC